MLPSQETACSQRKSHSRPGSLHHKPAVTSLKRCHLISSPVSSLAPSLLRSPQGLCPKFSILLKPLTSSPQLSKINFSWRYRNFSKYWEFTSFPWYQTSTYIFSHWSFLFSWKKKAVFFFPAKLKFSTTSALDSLFSWMIKKVLVLTLFPLSCIFNISPLDWTFPLSFTQSKFLSLIFSGSLFLCSYFPNLKEMSLLSRSRHFPSLHLPIWEASSVEKISEEKKKKINERPPLYSSVKNMKVNFTVYLIQCHLLNLYSDTCQRTLEALGLSWAIDKLFLHPGGQLNENPCMV